MIKKAMIITIMLLLTASIVSAQDLDWIISSPYLHAEQPDYFVGIGTTVSNPPISKLTVIGGNISVLSNGSQGGFLLAGENINAKNICDENGGNCLDLSAARPDGNSLDAPDGNPQDAVTVDNNGNVNISEELMVGKKLSALQDVSVTGRITTSSNITSFGNICDSRGCIGDMTSYWAWSTGDIHYTAGKVGIGTDAPNATLDLMSVLTSASIADLLVLRPISALANTGAAILFNTNTSMARLQYRQTGSGSGDFEFITPNSGSPTMSMIIKSDGKVGILTTPTATLDVAGDAKVLTALTADSINVEGNTINFGGGAQIITSNEDFIIRLP